MRCLRTKRSNASCFVLVTLVLGCAGNSRSHVQTSDLIETHLLIVNSDLLLTLKCARDAQEYRVVASYDFRYKTTSDEVPPDTCLAEAAEPILIELSGDFSGSYVGNQATLVTEVQTPPVLTLHALGNLQVRCSSSHQRQITMEASKTSTLPVLRTGESRIIRVQVPAHW